MRRASRRTAADAEAARHSPSGSACKVDFSLSFPRLRAWNLTADTRLSTGRIADSLYSPDTAAFAERAFAWAAVGPLPDAVSEVPLVSR